MGQPNFVLHWTMADKLFRHYTKNPSSAPAAASALTAVPDQLPKATGRFQPAKTVSIVLLSLDALSSFLRPTSN
jgi:hypothetical protein